MSTTITRRFEWDMGHRVPDHRSLCRNLHGHRYVAEVTVSGAVIDLDGNPENGMVCDFALVKEYVGHLIEAWDHALMMSETDPWLEFILPTKTKLVVIQSPPTAEKIAEEMYNRLRIQGAFRTKHLDIVEITVWETPNCKAIFKP